MNLSRIFSGITLFSGTVTFGLNAYADFLPKNNLHLKNKTSFSSGINEEEFKAVSQEIETEYRDIVSSHGGQLKMILNWPSGYVNAEARQDGNIWQIRLFGGLARYPGITRDAFTIVVCHELGHHLGGYPFVSNFGWAAASEGQSDYFATQACARRIWREQFSENERLGAKAPLSAKSNCDQFYKDAAERNLCYRIAAGSVALAEIMRAAAQDPLPKPETPDPSVVRQTDTEHPAAQCRLDTYLQGSYCRHEFDFAVIPGVGAVRRNSAEAEREAFATSCSVTNSSKREARPSCWFRAQTE